MIKLDGYRMSCAIDDGVVKLESRRGQDWTHAFPELVAAAKQLSVQRAFLDGEIAVLLPNGKNSFQALQNQRTRRLRPGTLVYCAFDLLHLDGAEIGSRPLEQRKIALEELRRDANASAVIRYVEHSTAPGPDVFAQACKLGLEAIISKRRDRPYHPGRSTSWRKAKCRPRQEFVVGGFTAGEGARQGIGALLLGAEETCRAA